MSDDSVGENEVIEQAPNLVRKLHKILVKVENIVLQPLKTNAIKDYNKNNFEQELILILNSKLKKVREFAPPLLKFILNKLQSGYIFSLMLSAEIMNPSNHPKYGEKLQDIHQQEKVGLSNFVIIQ